MVVYFVFFDVIINGTVFQSSFSSSSWLVPFWDLYLMPRVFNIDSVSTLNGCVLNVFHLCAFWRLLVYDFLVTLHLASWLSQSLKQTLCRFLVFWLSQCSPLQQSDLFIFLSISKLLFLSIQLRKPSCYAWEPFPSCTIFQKVSLI